MPDHAAARARPVTAARFDLWPLPDLRPSIVRDDPAETAGPSPEELAYQSGERDGQAAAREQHASQVEAACATLARAATVLVDAETSWRKQLDDNLLLLASAIASHVIEKEVVLDPSFVNRLVHRALALVGPTPVRLMIRIHPDDADAVTRETAKEPFAALPNVTIVPDAGLRRGGCVVETPGRLVDARVETALAGLVEAMRDD